MDENLFLEGKRFQEALRQKGEAVFAGKSYEGNPNRLRAQFEGYFTRTDGPVSLCREAGGENYRKSSGVGR